MTLRRRTMSVSLICIMMVLGCLALTGCNSDSIKDAPPSGITSVTEVETSKPGLIEEIDAFFETEDLPAAYKGTSENGTTIYFTAAGDHAMVVMINPSQNRNELYFNHGKTVGLNAKYGDMEYSITDSTSGYEIRYVSKLVNSDRMIFENGDGSIAVQRIPLIDMQDAAHQVVGAIYPPEK